MSRRALSLLALALALAACAKPAFDVRAPSAPAVERTEAVEHGWEVFAGAGGVRLFGQYWRPPAGAPPPRAAVVVMHGLKDHGSRYAAFAGRLVRAGYAVHAFDLRGHGRSAGRRVTIDSFDEYLDDLSIWTARVRAREPGLPVFAYGHSMGGIIVTLSAITRAPAYAGIILSAPPYRLDAWPVKIALARATARMVPNAGVIDPANADFSSDPQVVREMDSDPLIYQDPGPARTASELLGATAAIWASIDRLTVPALFLHGTGDTLTAARGSQEIHARAGSTDKTLKLYAGYHHDLISEPGRATLIEDVVAWLDARSGIATTAATAATAAPPPSIPHPQHPSSSLTLDLQYQRRTDAGDGDGFANLVVAGLRSRHHLRRATPSRSLALCTGLDVHLGAGDGPAGLAYEAALYPLGLTLPVGAGSLVSLCAGAGLGGVRGAVPFAWQLPVEASAELQLGPLRLLASAKASWLAGTDRSATLAVRLGRDVRYWGTTTAGSGLYLGATARELGGDRFLGLTLGVSHWGGE